MDRYKEYIDECKKLREYEYSETDKAEINQFIVCIGTIAASSLILFLCGDVGRTCVVAIWSASLSLVSTHISSVYSQKAFKYLREQVMNEDMSVDYSKKHKYDKMAIVVSVANDVSSVWMITGLISLALRCNLGAA